MPSADGTFQQSTDTEKAKLWRLSRADAAANVKEKDGYDPSK